jgi:LL-diaminopimelate aminotransferase
MTGFPIEIATRIKLISSYPFAGKMKQAAIARGVDIINLGIGESDLPTPSPIIESLAQAAKDPKRHQYPSYEGMLEFRKAVADWYSRRFKVVLDPADEVLTLIGSKEGIGHIHLAFVDPGDIVLVPSPCYQAYPIGTIFSGGISHMLPLTKENGFLPDLSAIPKDIAKKAKLMWLNSPNNPTSVIMTKDYFKRVVEFAHENQVIVCHDAAFSEIYYDGRRPASFMEVEGAKDVGVEFHSLSKTYNMTGWRLGYAVGRKEILAGLGKVKSNLDSGVFEAVQVAGIIALGLDDSVTDNFREIYQERRDTLILGLKKLGLEVDTPPATFCVWVRVPKGYTSTTFTTHLLEKAGIVTTPGNAFGVLGEGYIRMTLSTSKERLEEAVERMKKADF